MSELKLSSDISTVTLGQTEGLTSAQQSIDITANEAFSFSDSTSIIEDSVIIFPFYRVANFEAEENKKDIIKKFESIVKKKLKKTIDVKKLYYEQFENTVF